MSSNTLKHNDTKNMTAGSPIKLMFSFALPLMLGNVCQQLYTVTDTAIVGRGVGLTALAALGSVDWLTFLLFGLAQGFTQGFSIKMAQQYGAGNIEGLKKTVGTSAVLSAVIAVITTIFGLGCLPLFIRILNVPEELREMAVLYISILFGGVALALFNNFCASSLRAVGNSRTPLIAMISSSFVNIALDSLAVFVLKWGIAGAAGATVFSQFVAGTICCVKMRRTPELRIEKRHLRSDAAMTKELLGLGLPISAQNVALSIGGVLVIRVVNSFGKSFIAGYTASSKLYGILEIAAISYSYAVTTYIGQNYGAGLFSRVRAGMKDAAKLCLITSAGVAAVMILFGRQITGLFISTDDIEAAQIAGKAAYSFIVWMASCLPILYLLYSFRSALQGVGKPSFGLISAALEFVARVLCAYLAGKYIIETLLFVAEVSAWAVGAAVVIAAWIVFQKKLKRIEDKKQPQI